MTNAWVVTFERRRHANNPSADARVLSLNFISSPPTPFSQAACSGPAVGTNGAAAFSFLALQQEADFNGYNFRLKR